MDAKDAKEDQEQISPRRRGENQSHKLTIEGAQKAEDAEREVIWVSTDENFESKHTIAKHAVVMSEPEKSKRSSPESLYCPNCAREIPDPLICGDCSSVICRV